jgi:dihydrolipoamide dehydrogenase
MSSYDLIVIGAGPGGEVGAIYAAQKGLKVALIEKRDHLGGTCLNVGCIPTKALVESSKTWAKLNHLEELGFSASNLKINWEKIQARKDQIVDAQRKGLTFLMKKNKIDVYKGFGKLTSKNTVDVLQENSSLKLSTKYILLATGSRVKDLPFAPPDHKRILTSDSILSIDHIPKSLGIIGGGVIGMEFASIFQQLGTKVSVFEMADQILPFEDPETAAELTKYLKKHKVHIHTSTKINNIKVQNNEVLVHCENLKPETFDKVLVSIGRSPVTDHMGLGEIGVATTKGYVNVDAHYQTSVPNIFAIGDILTTPALAHTASAEALHAVNIILGISSQPINYNNNPSCVYSYPEVASVGFHEPYLKAKDISYSVAKFPFAPMAKAKIENATEGFIKILYEPKFREILGVHIVGAKATEMISEFVLGKNLETTVDEIAHSIHPHPTLSETIMETAHSALHKAIHL